MISVDNENGVKSIPENHVEFETLDKVNKVTTVVSANKELVSGNVRVPKLPESLDRSDGRQETGLDSVSDSNKMERYTSKCAVHAVSLGQVMDSPRTQV